MILQLVRYLETIFCICQLLHALDVSGGRDFQQRSETVTVLSSDTQVVISVQILSDNLLEDEERFSVFIASLSDETTVTQSTAQVTIVDSSKGR